MTLNRRDFLKLAAAGAASALAPNLATAAASAKAIAFDGFTVFDPRNVFAKAEALVPGQGAEFLNLWRSRLFEYQWLRVVGGHYADFWQIGLDSLSFAANMLHLELQAEQRESIMQEFMNMKAWPDALPVLTRLKSAGIRMAFLSNLTEAILLSSTQAAGLDGLFETPQTTDRIKTYKPDPLAYQLGMVCFRLKRDEIVFAASSGWDAAGAKWFGYKTVWVNRKNQLSEELAPAADLVTPDLNGLADFLSVG